MTGVRHLLPVTAAVILALALSLAAIGLGFDATTKWALAVPLALLLVALGVPYALLERAPRARLPRPAGRAETRTPRS